MFHPKEYFSPKFEQRWKQDSNQSVLRAITRMILPVSNFRDWIQSQNAKIATWLIVFASTLIFLFPRCLFYVLPGGRPGLGRPGGDIPIGIGGIGGAIPGGPGGLTPICMGGPLIGIPIPIGAGGGIPIGIGGTIPGGPGGLIPIIGGPGGIRPMPIIGGGPRPTG